MPLVRVRECPKADQIIELWYETFGDSTHPAVLLVMGLNASMMLWHTAFCEALAARGFYVIRFDNRDIGKSTKLDHMGVPSICGLVCLPNFCAPKPPYTLEDFALDAVGLLDALHISRAHVMGQSMGGMISQIIAAEHPSRVMSLTSIYSSPGNPDPSLKIKLKMAEKPKDAERGTFIEHMRSIARECFIAEELWDEAYLDRLHGELYDYSTYIDGATRQASAIVRQTSRIDRVKSIKCPVLIVHGKKDVVVEFKHGEWTKELIPHATMLTFDNMGHGIMPPLFDAICDGFVTACGRADTEPMNEAPSAPVAESKPMM